MKGPWYLNMDYNFDNISILVLFVFSLFADVIVVLEHWRTPPHPKFLLLWYRKFFIALHVVSGTGEIIALVTSFFVQEPKYAAIAAAILDLLHDLSAFAQTPNVFGVQAIMHPAYITVTTAKLIIACCVLSNPESLDWAIRLFAMHHIYVWCRVFYFFLHSMKIFQSNVYSIAILLAGFMCVSIGLGPIGPLIFFFCVAVYWWGFVPLVYSKQEKNKLRVERALNMFVNPAYQSALHSAAISAQKTNTNSVLLEALSPREQAELLFDSLTGQCPNGKVTTEVAIEALQSWGFPPDAYAALSKMESDATVTFETFFRSMASAIGVFKTPALSAIARSDKERADAVFNILDLDGSGVIEMSELKVLLVSWGMTSQEAEDTVVAKDSNGDGVISRDEFFLNFVPVWRYAWEEIKASVRISHMIQATQQSHHDP